ncbi:uncharacterized protein TNCV_4736371 [Trichonephila clavipes]|nr:uncharacterized protein TNCV_4736371 [Trichonephila clavipes]
MDDNATCHRTLAVQDCLDSEGIQRLVWPACSLDLNPIENVRYALERQVAGRNYPPTNKNTLIRALTEEWDKLPQQLLDNVVQSMRYWARTHDMPAMIRYLSHRATAAPEILFSEIRPFQVGFESTSFGLEAQRALPIALQEHFSMLQERRKRMFVWGLHDWFVRTLTLLI